MINIPSSNLHPTFILWNPDKPRSLFGLLCVCLLSRILFGYANLQGISPFYHLQPAGATHLWAFYMFFFQKKHSKSLESIIIHYYSHARRGKYLHIPKKYINFAPIFECTIVFLIVAILIIVTFLITNRTFPTLPLIKQPTRILTD